MGKNYKSKMEPDSVLRSLPVVGMFFRDVLMMFATPFLRPRPLPFSQNSVSSQNQACHQRFEKFVQVAQAGAIDFFIIGERGPWWIMLTIFEGRETTGIFMRVHQIDF
jgi:hypothetical protein